MPPRVLLIGSMLLLGGTAWGCDLCAIYNADSATSKSTRGFSLAVSAQFIPYRTVKRDGTNLPPSIYDEAFLDRSMFHIVPTWNFSQRFAVSLSLPIAHQRFRFLKYTPTAIETVNGEETGIGDLALIGRGTIFKATREKAALSVNLLAGIKFPTGDSQHMQEEVALQRTWEELLGPGHPHTVSGVHPADVSLGSDSYDGVFGVTVNSRWSRLFVNGQFQYYLRTSADGYRYGDAWMISGGPGVFLFLEEPFTISLQCFVNYEQLDSDLLLGLRNANTGRTSTYLGPQLNITIGERFAFNAGADLPVQIENKGLQNVPDYRLHAGFSYRF